MHHTNGQKKHINGIGPQKAREIERWRQNLKSAFAANMPKILPPSQEAVGVHVLATGLRRRHHRDRSSGRVVPSPPDPR